MKVKVTQSEEALVRLVSLMSFEKPTYISIDTWESHPEVKSLVFYRKWEDSDEYDVVNDIAINSQHFPTLDPRKIYKISSLEVPDEWKSVE